MLCILVLGWIGIKVISLIGWSLFGKAECIFGLNEVLINNEDYGS